MAAFNNLALTVSGIKALLAAQAGTTLTLSKIGMGSGRAANSTSLTGLVTPEAMLPITETKTDSESGCLTVIAKMTNEDIEEGFYWRETGLFFEDAEGNDVLFAYACVDTEYDYVPAYSDQRYIKHVRIANIITDSADINIKEAEGLLYVDTLTFEEFKTEVNSLIKAVRPRNTFKSIYEHLPEVNTQTDIRAVMHMVDSGVYTCTVLDTPLLTFPDVGCADAIIRWERQDNPNGYVYGTLSIASMYRNDASGKKLPAILYTCSIFNTTDYTEWKCVSGAEDGLHSGDIYEADGGGVFSDTLTNTHACWNKLVTVVGQNIAGAPHTGDIWAEVFTGGTASRGFQFVFSCFSHGRSIWVRFMHDYTWSGWFEFFTSKSVTATELSYLKGVTSGVQGQLDGKQSRVELLENVDLHSIANSDDMFKDYIFKVTSGTYADYHLPPESGHWGVSIRSSYMTNWDNGMLIIAHNRNSGNIYVCNKVSGKYSVWKKVSVSGEWTYTKVIDSKYSGQVNTDVLQHMYVTAKATVNGNVMTGSVFIGELGLWGSKNIYLAHGSSWCKFDVTATYVKVSFSGDVADEAVAYFMDK